MKTPITLAKRPSTVDVGIREGEDKDKPALEAPSFPRHLVSLCDSIPLSGARWQCYRSLKGIIAPCVRGNPFSEFCFQTFDGHARWINPTETSRKSSLPGNSHAQTLSPRRFDVRRTSASRSRKRQSRRIVRGKCQLTSRPCPEDKGEEA